MDDKLFQSDEEIATAIQNLRELAVNEGWLLVKRILNENIKELEKILLDPENRTELDKEQLEMIGWRRKYMEILRDTPETFIDRLLEVEAGELELDPFDKD